MTTKLMHLYWLFGWFLIGFGVPESIGLFTGHPEWTLSDFVWNFEGLDPRKPSSFFTNPIHWHPLHWVMFIGMVWLFGHFIDHIWR